jgi:hypothetical protein
MRVSEPRNPIKTSRFLKMRLIIQLENENICAGIMPNLRRKNVSNSLKVLMLVPVERIELPTFGLQNRCSTAELNRRIEATGEGKYPPRGPFFGGSNIRLGRKGPEPEELRASLAYKKGGFPAAFPECDLRPAYWQRCCRPSSPRNSVPGTQTNPLRRAYSSPPKG